MDQGKRNSKHKPRVYPWESEDSTLLLDEYRVVFGEKAFLLEYMQMGRFHDVFNGQSKAGAVTAVNDADFEKQFPTLAALMTLQVDDDQQPRKVCTLTIVCEDGQVKAGINERDRGLSLWTSSQTLGGVFAALEEALGQRPVAWRKVMWKGRGAKP